MTAATPPQAAKSSPPAFPPTGTMSARSHNVDPLVRMNHRPAPRGFVPSYFPPAISSPPTPAALPRRRIIRRLHTPTNSTSPLAKFFTSFITAMRRKRLFVRDSEADEDDIEQLWKAYEVLNLQGITVGGLQDVKELDVVRLGVPKWVWGYVRQEALKRKTGEGEDKVKKEEAF